MPKIIENRLISGTPGVLPLKAFTSLAALGVFSTKSKQQLTFDAAVGVLAIAVRLR